jgi:hypothetical protein
MPLIYAQSPTTGGSDHSGLGDITQSFFLSPKAPVGGWILGAGPVALWPTATDSALGAGKWGAGPTIVALQQQHGFTYGILANQIWSYAGWGSQNVNATFLQPFVSFTTKKFTTFAVNTESTYDWQGEQWTVPVNFMVQQLVKIGGHPVAFQVGYRYYADKPNGGLGLALRRHVPFSEKMKNKVTSGRWQVAGGRKPVLHSPLATGHSPLDTRHLTKICPALTE